METRGEKFAPPRLPEKIVSRAGVVRAVSEAAANNGVVAVSAPAGYGKTVSLLLWLRETEQNNVAWMKVDPYDDAPALFYRRFCSALASVRPESEALSRVLSNPSFGASPAENTIDALLQMQREEGGSCVLVLDDLHLIANGEIARSLPFVLKRLPDGDIVFLISRGMAASRLAPPEYGIETPLLDAGLLKFSEQETMECVAAFGHAISDKEAKTVTEVCGGWPLAICAMAAEGTFFGKNARDAVLSDCIKRQFWEPSDEKTRLFLLKISVPDEITPSLCAALTGGTEKRARERLDKLTWESSMIRKASDGPYVCDALLLDFLRSRLALEDVDERTLCDIVADRYLAEGDDYRGTYYALRGRGGMEKAASAMRMRDADRRISVAEHAERLGFYVFDRVSDGVMEQYPFFHINAAWHAYLIGDARILEKHLDRLYEHLPRIESDYSEFLETAVLACCMDHRCSMADLAYGLGERFVGVAAEGGPQVSSMTQNLPFMHRSLRDFSGLAKDNVEVEAFRAVFAAALKEGYPLAESVVTGGLFYEQNDLAEALSRATLVNGPLYESSLRVPELGFSAKMLLAATLDALGRDREAKVCRDDIERYLRDVSALYLRPNYMAYMAKLRLQNGEREAVSEWLDGSYADFSECGDGSRLSLFRIFQHMTTARALMTREDANKARNFIERLTALASDFARPLDVAEAKVLRSLLEWYRGSKDTGVRYLEEAVLLMQEYRFVRVFADEGAALLPLLRKLKRKRVEKKGKGSIDPAFIDEISLAAQTRSKERRGISAAMRVKPAKLSKQQTRVIKFLAEGYGHAEIAVLVGLSYNTVKSHCAQAYKKLGAKNAAEAIKKAKEWKLVSGKAD